MTLSFLFVYCFLFVNYYSNLLLQLYRTGHFIAELTLYQTLESGKETSFTDQTTVAMSHYNWHCSGRSVKVVVLN